MVAAVRRGEQCLKVIGNSSATGAATSTATGTAAAATATIAAPRITCAWSLRISIVAVRCLHASASTAGTDDGGHQSRAQEAGPDTDMRCLKHEVLCFENRVSLDDARRQTAGCLLQPQIRKWLKGEDQGSDLVMLLVLLPQVFRPTVFPVCFLNKMLMPTVIPSTSSGQALTGGGLPRVFFIAG